MPVTLFLVSPLTVNTKLLLVTLLTLPVNVTLPPTFNSTSSIVTVVFKRSLTWAVILTGVALVYDLSPS